MRRLALLSVLMLLLSTAVVSAVEVRHVESISVGLTSPTSLVVGNDYIGVLEPFTRQLVTFSSSGVVMREVDLDVKAAGLAALDATRFLVGDSGAGNVVTVNQQTGEHSVFLSGLVDPRGLVVTNSEVFVLDAGRSVIMVTDRQGAMLEQVGLSLPDPGQASWFSALAWDGQREVFHVLDQTNSQVVTYNRAGEVVRTVGGFGSTDGELTRGGEVVCDAEGWVYVTDRYQGQIVIFDASGDFVAYTNPLDLGLPGLSVPVGLAVDAEGFLYVSATESAMIQIFHVDKSANSVPELLARPVSPGQNGSVPANGLRFVAGLQGPASALDPLLGDFRLVARSDTTVVVGRGNGVPATGVTFVGDLQIASATWQPELTLTAGLEYGWQARARSGDTQGTWTAWSWFVPSVVRLPYRLEQNSPNPFNPRTVISFNLAGDGPSRLHVFDIRGHRVWSREVGSLGAGTHQVLWEGEDSGGAALPSGIYFYRLEAGQFSETRKMVLTR